jgi:hypothetical protein
VGENIIRPNNSHTFILTHRAVKLVLITIFALSSNIALACNIGCDVHLNTFGAKVLVELRLGAPGNSSVVGVKRSSGGLVSFDGLCSGRYFLAIGDDESVSVTPVRNFEDNYTYTSNIKITTGSGNVLRRSRDSL